MYVLSSDYDGTLKTRIHDLNINVHELQRFRELGNIFILNTGRHFLSISKEIETFDIPFNYLCCNDGAVTFDEHLNIVKEHVLPDDQVYFIQDLALYMPGFKNSHYYTAKEILNEAVSGTIEVEIVKEHKASFEELTNIISSHMKDIIYFIWKDSIYIKSNTSKSTALDELAGTIGIDPKTIYTFGDQANDFEMIKNHHGFRMLESSPKLWTSTWRVVPEVHHLVKYLNFKSKRSK